MTRVQPLRREVEEVSAGLQVPEPRAEDRHVLVCPPGIDVPEGRARKQGATEVDRGRLRNRDGAGEPLEPPLDYGGSYRKPGPCSGDAGGGLVEGVGEDLDASVHGERGDLGAGARLAERDRADARPRLVDVGPQVPRSERVDERSVLGLTEVEMPGASENVPQDRVLRERFAAVVSRGPDVPVHERHAVRRVDRDLVPGHDPDFPGANGVNGLPGRSDDVDARMKREATAGAHDALLARRSSELRSRIAEVSADRVLSSERLDRPRKGLRRNGPRDNRCRSARNERE